MKDAIQITLEVPLHKMFDSNIIGKRCFDTSDVKITVTFDYLDIDYSISNGQICHENIFLKNCDYYVSDFDEESVDQIILERLEKETEKDEGKLNRYLFEAKEVRSINAEID